MTQDSALQHFEALTAALQAEQIAYQTLHALLREEQAALSTGDADGLMALAQRKSAQVAHLAQLAEARNRQLVNLTGQPDQAGIAAWCDRFDPADRSGVRRLWHALLEVARAARALNEENGALIQARLQHNQQALAVLHGAAQDVAHAYGPDGQPCPGPAGRPLGKA
ncbi:flagella synthesis protein FlgN [Thiobacter aerophilum]|uniref:Flagellar protein FlgN n=1 Tax=Thiobacter aerophilum TaxID=3121275 RepID=A0ABV0EJK4_9BURK